MFAFLGGVTIRHPWLVCLSWVLLAITLTVLAPPWEQRAQDEDIHFLPARCASVRGFQLLRDAFPQEVFASRLILVVERNSQRLHQQDLELVDQLVTDLSALREREPELQIRKIYSRRDAFIGNRLLSEDGQCTLVQISLDTPYLALQTQHTVDRIAEVVHQRLSQVQGDRPAVHLSGPAGVGRDLLDASGRSLDGTTWATVLLVVVVLFAVYRSPLLVLIPLFSIVLAVWVALKILALLTLIPGFYLVQVSQIFAIVMLYGAGTDYCLFLISRYREELASTPRVREALLRAIQGVGGAVAASAATVICGMALMITAEFAKVRCGGPAIAISLAVALLASLTLTPALLYLSGRAAFWPQRLTAPLPRGSFLVWESLSRFVVARPLLCALLGTALLLPFALLGLQIRPTYRATAELSPSSSSIQGLQAIQRHFPLGELGPITVLLESSVSWDTPESRRMVEILSQGFSLLPHVVEVRSLIQPLGSPIEEPPAPPTTPRKNLRGSLFTAVWKKATQTVTEQIHKQARSFYIAQVPTPAGAPPRHVTRLDVVLDLDPFDPRAQQTLQRLRLWLEQELPQLSSHQVRAECYGTTVSSEDLASITEADRRRINLLVLAGIFLILLLLVRSPLLAAYLLLTVLLSYLATLGATSVLAHYWHGRPFGEIDWRVPFFLFTILVAVGEDYNILLISRALEERKRHGGMEGIRRALAATGGIITSCGVIMAGTFATLMLAGLTTLVQVGFALSLGVLLDTFLVRPILVPAFVVWLWREDRPAPIPLPRSQGLRHAA